MKTQQCVVCQKHLVFWASSKDHFWPRRFKGKQGFHENIWKICRTCNTKKADKFPTARHTALFSKQKGFCRL